MTRSKAPADSSQAQEIVSKPFARQLLDYVQDPNLEPSPQLHKLESVSVSLPLSTMKSCCPKLNGAFTSFLNNLEPSKILSITNMDAIRLHICGHLGE